MITIHTDSTKPNCGYSHVDVIGHITFKAISSILVCEECGAFRVGVTQSFFLGPEFQFDVGNGGTIHTGTGCASNDMTMSHYIANRCIRDVAWADAIIQCRDTGF